MPVTWKILDGAILEITGTGAVTEPEYLAAHAEWFALPPTGAALALTLADWSAVTQMDFRSDAIRQSVRMTREFVTRSGARGRMALVAQNPSVYGMSRMWEQLFDGSPVAVQVFHGRDEALAWLRR